MGSVPVTGRARVAAIAWALAVGLALAGCEPADPNAATPTSTATSSAPRKAAAPTGGGDADMVAAFSATRGANQGLVDLRFRLAKRPAVGEPVEIDLQMIPTVELERLFARFQVADGLQIVSGAESEHFERPAKGMPVAHRMTVTAKSDGIFYVTAVVLADSDKESVARTFSFPVIAGQGLLEQPAAAPPAASVASPKQALANP